MELSMKTQGSSTLTETFFLSFFHSPKQHGEGEGVRKSFKGPQEQVRTDHTWDEPFRPSLLQ